MLSNVLLFFFDFNIKKELSPYKCLSSLDICV
jgi:hypothetical protein